MLDTTTAKKLRAFERALAELRSVGHLAPAGLAADWQLLRRKARGGRRLVGRVAGLTQRAAGGAGKARLPSAADAISRCVRLGALSAEVNYVTLVRLASFPAYRYEAIEGEMLATIVNEQLGDFGRFHDEMAAYLGGQ